MLLVIMALEGFFFTHKFGLDLMDAERKEEVYALMADLTGTAEVKAREEKVEG